MSNMYYMVTITKREYGDLFSRFFYDSGVHCLTAALCDGTAQQKTLDLLGIEKTEKIMLSAAVSGPLAGKLLHGLMRTMQIDVPGNGISFTIPLQSAANLASLHYLTQGQKDENEVSKMEENRFSLVVVIAEKGYTELVMEAARAFGAGGGTVIHTKGISEKNSAAFFGMSIAAEQELIYIVSRRQDEKDIMRAVIEKAGPRQEGVSAVFSLPVNHVVGLRSLTDE